MYSIKLTSVYICVYNVYKGNDWSFPYKKQSQISSQGLPNSHFQVIIPFLLHPTISFLSNWDEKWRLGVGKRKRKKISKSDTIPS